MAEDLFALARASAGDVNFNSVKHGGNVSNIQASGHIGSDVLDRLNNIYGRKVVFTKDAIFLVEKDGIIHTIAFNRSVYNAVHL